jgi:hypothetical protein
VDHQPLGAPNLNVMAVQKLFRLGYSFAVVATNQRFETDKMPVETDGVRPIFLHRLIQGPKFTGEKFGDIRRPQGIVAVAIETLKLPAADVLAQQEPHWLFALRTGRGRGVFGHDTSRWTRREHCELPVTDYCQDWGGDGKILPIQKSSCLHGTGL